jgi:hypothetical protein
MRSDKPGLLVGFKGEALDPLELGSELLLQFFRC